jgi:Ca2+-transporting ATPase
VSGHPAWHRLTPQEAATTLGVEPDRGLSTEVVRERLVSHGPNTLPETPPPSMWTLLWRQLKSFIILVLLGAVILSFAIREIGDALAILAALLLNVAVGFLMDFRSERDIASLTSVSSPRARVRRDGHEVDLPAQELVPGDILLLASGDRVPADARILSGECSIDESLLTGESVPVDKHSAALATAAPPLAGRVNEVFAGSLVRTGAGAAVVTATGARTEIGRIGSLLSATEPAPVPLNIRLAALGRYIIWTVGAVCALLVGVGLWQGQPFWQLLRTAVVLAVAAIPEGLPSVATLALAAAARRLLKRNLRVRHLGVLESLGGITTLCMDKTGTLTANAMTVRAVKTAGHALEVTGEGWTPTGDFLEISDPFRAAPDLPAL